jgi:zinc protease
MEIMIINKIYILRTTTIGSGGSLEDLQNISSRRKDFYRWYIPNNVTLTIAGDFDVKQAKTWVQKYLAK